jgi:hypothetical protein
LKYLFLLTLFAAVAFLIYWRLRPYIRGVRRFLGVVREVRRMNAGAPPSGATPQPRPASGEKLVRCASCGTWISDSQAVKLRATGATYCSHSCLERAADAQRRAQKSAS